MSESQILPPADNASYQAGRRAGIALAAFALALVAFVNLLGIEKSLLAGVLALFALRGAGGGEAVRRWGRLALVLAGVHLVVFAVVVILLHDQLGQLFHLLQTLG